MFKKIILVLTAIILVLSFAACKSDGKDKQGPSSSNASSQYDNIIAGDYAGDDTGSKHTFSDPNLNQDEVEELWQQMNPTTSIN